MLIFIVIIEDIFLKEFLVDSAEQPFSSPKAEDSDCPTILVMRFLAVRHVGRLTT